MLNKVVVSVPRVLDSAFIEIKDSNVTLSTSDVPSSAVLPFAIQEIKTSPSDTRMNNFTIEPILNRPNYYRVTANIIMPIRLTVTDSNQSTFYTYSDVTKPQDIILFIPDYNSATHTISCEGRISANVSTATKTATVFNSMYTRILIRATANTDLLIPIYGYAPINNPIYYQAETGNDAFNQPLFPVGKKY